VDAHVTVTNTGRTTGRQVLVVLDLPAGLTSSDTEWSRCTGGQGDLCRTIDTLAPGGSEQMHIAFAATAGSYPLTVAVGDAAGVTGSASKAITVSAQPAVVGVTVPTEIVLESGVPTTVSVTAANVGGSDATDVVLRVDLPADVTWTQGSGCAGRTGSNQALECRVGTLAAGASQTMTFQVIAQGNGAHGKHVVFAAVWDVPGSSEDASSGPVSTPIRVVEQAAAVRLSLEPQTTFVQGVPRDLVATVTNAGTTAAAGLTATFQLPGETFWERTAAGSAWTCSSTGGAGPTVTCTTPSLAAGQYLELAGSIRANTSQTGRFVSVSLTWTGGSSPVTAQTEIVIGTLPACEPAWQVGRYYRAGDLVSYHSWNYERLRDSWALIQPERLVNTWWRSLGACA
jgi:hypothetical protein